MIKTRKIENELNGWNLEDFIRSRRRAHLISLSAALADGSLATRRWREKVYYWRKSNWEKAAESTENKFICCCIIARDSYELEKKHKAISILSNQQMKFHPKVRSLVMVEWEFERDLQFLFSSSSSSFTGKSLLVCKLLLSFFFSSFSSLSPRTNTNINENNLSFVSAPRFSAVSFNGRFSLDSFCCL